MKTASHPQIALTSEDGSTKLMVNADDLILQTNGIPYYLRQEEAVLIAVYVADMMNEEDSRLWVKKPKEGKFYHYGEQQYSCTSARSSLLTASAVIGNPHYIVVIEEKLPQDSQQSQEDVQEIRNKTPQSITMVDDEGKPLTVFPTMGEPIRYETIMVPDGEPIAGVPITKTMLKNTLLPKSEKGVFFIVDKLVAELSHREDFLFVSDEVKNENGEVIGYKSLSRPFNSH